MKIPFKYIVRNFTTRKLTSFITIFGIALVVFVFAAVLMMAFGIQKTLKATGSDGNVTITRKSANGEISSLINGDTQNIISTLPHIAKGNNGQPLITYDPVVIINLDRVGGGLSNITVRGVSPTATQIRPQVKVIEGRMFNFGLRELIAGEALLKNYEGVRIGKTIKFAGDNWKIVGIFSTDGTGFDSEIWGDSKQLLAAFNRENTVSSVTVKLDDPENFDAFKRSFETDRRLQQFEPKTEKDYFEEQSQGMATFIRVLGIFITIIFSFGATIGAMITMYSTVANRTVEVGTLRSLGFSRSSILFAFLTESEFIAIVGGALGLIIASFLQFFTISVLNFGSFSEISFSFAISPSIIIYS
ncbi:MAG: ABC transporter permease, partial [Ignavibacteriaceae bacterium]